MLSYDGQVKLVDFGIAKAMFSVREETRTGALKGKVAYMAPEQVTGESPGPESDVFALGVVLYEMLIGRRLFKGQNDFETINRVKTMPIPPPSRVAQWVPHELDDVVMRSLERERTQRYRRAALMVRDLDTFLQTARFSTEQMAEWMASTFPPESRIEVPDGQGVSPETGGSRSRSTFGTPSGSMSGKSGRGSLSLVPEDVVNGTVPGTSRARAGSASGVGPAATSPKMLVMIAVGLVLAVAAGVGGALLVTSSRAHRDATAAAQEAKGLAATTPAPGATTTATRAPAEAPTPTAAAVPAAATATATPSTTPSATAPSATTPSGTAPSATAPTTTSATPTTTTPTHATTSTTPARKTVTAPKATAGKGKSGKTRIEAFDDEESSAPKIQTFDD